MALKRSSLVAFLDVAAERPGFENLRGGMTRVPESRWYRRPPKGAPSDVPTTETLYGWYQDVLLRTRALPAKPPGSPTGT